MYCYYKHDLPEHFLNFFCLNSDVHFHSTRQTAKVHFQYARTDIMQSQLRVAGPRISTIDFSIVETICYQIYVWIYFRFVSEVAFSFLHPESKFPMLFI